MKAVGGWSDGRHKASFQLGNNRYTGKWRPGKHKLNYLGLLDKRLACKDVCVGNHHGTSHCHRDGKSRHHDDKYNHDDKSLPHRDGEVASHVFLCLLEDGERLYKEERKSVYIDSFLKTLNIIRRHLSLSLPL
jgi:hypothetical protein